MIILTLSCVIIELHTTLSQFPDHLDVQKVGEITINNEKYNVLKPSLHVTDYFKDFMLRRENKGFPTKRIFMDDNGLRHFWSGFRDKNLRKSDKNNSSNSSNVKVEIDVVAEVKTDTKESSNTRIKKARKGLKRNKIRKKSKNSMPVKKVVEDDDELLREREKERTMATTTFFCPFFGVITMNAFID